MLIPRPDTEALVEVALERTRDRSMHGAALDLCTGSGCVAIALAKQRPTWSVTATDVDEDSAALAWENVLRTGVAHHLRLLLGDLFGAVPAGERFDLVTANLRTFRAATSRRWTPTCATTSRAARSTAGPTASTLVRRIVEEAPARLTEGGCWR